MRLSFDNNVVGLAAETPAEEAICELLRASDGYVFRLHAATHRGLAFSEIGQEDEARRAPLNIVRSMEPRFALISNLARTPFTLDGEIYASVEGFWQGLKSAEPAQRRILGKLSGGEAKGRGDSLGRPQQFDYEGTTIVSGSPEHWELMRRACEAKFTQHAGARAALLNSGQRWLTHRTRKDSRTIPGAIMADIWMQIRAKLLDEAGSTR